jgi:uncharacterized membrane protein YedE/YeeE
MIASVEFSPYPATVGGVLIGMASALALALNGKVPGISGVFGRILRAQPGDTAWRILFILGLACGAALTFTIYAPAAGYHPSRNLAVTAVAGLLVGVGTRVGGGCTSGHGVCGLGRRSPRSLVATMIFMAWAFLTVYVFEHMVGVGR